MVKDAFERKIENSMLKLFSTTRFAGVKLMLDTLIKDGVYAALKELINKTEYPYLSLLMSIAHLARFTRPELTFVLNLLRQLLL
jgi:hypothetical protein